VAKEGTIILSNNKVQHMSKWVTLQKGTTRSLLHREAAGQIAFGNNGGSEEDNPLLNGLRDYLTPRR